MENLDALFIRAPQLIWEPASRAILPEGILLTTVLEKNGIHTKYHNVDFLGKSIPTLTLKLEDRKKLLKEKEKFFKLRHPKWLKLKKILKKYRPKVVIIYPHKPYNYDPSILAAKLIKKVLPDTKTIIWNVLGIYDYFIKNNYVDFVIKGNYGDTEYITLNLIKSILNGNLNPKTLPNIVFKKNGKIIHTKTKIVLENLNEFPIPDRDLVIDKDLYPRYSFGWIEGARGCKYKCNYCRESTKFFPVRFRDPKKIVKEIMISYTKYHTREFYFYMSSFTSSHKWLKEICRLIQEKNLNIIFGCYTTASEITDSIIKQMKAAGCLKISFGIESGSERILKLMNRSVEINDLLKATKIVKRNGIFLLTTTIIGYPYEKKEDIDLSVDLTLKIKPDMFAMPIFVPMPELSLTKKLEKEGRIKDKKYYEYFSSEVKVKNENINPVLLKKLYNKYAKLSYRMDIVLLKKCLFKPKYFRAKIVEYFFNCLLKLKPFFNLIST